MSRYPRDRPNARLECDVCEGPVVMTADRDYVCVNCGSVPVE